jgi:calcineurin-like phosphoesterase
VATGFPAESKFWSYSENVSTPVNELEKGNELIIRPNPFCGTFEISYSVTQKALILIRITDIMGQIIYSESIPEFFGDLKKSIDISDKAKGIYFIEVSDGTTKKIQKILSN